LIRLQKGLNFIWTDVDRPDRQFLSIVLLLSFFQGFWAIYNYGYMGQDFGTHMAYALDYFGWRNFKSPNAPMFYWIPRISMNIVGKTFFVEAMSIGFLILNTIGLAMLFWILNQVFKIRFLKWGAFLLVVFFPVRAIHSVVYAGDAVMFLPFVAVTLLVFKLFNTTNNERQIKYWMVISIVTSIATCLKYSFIALGPVLFLVYLIQVRCSISRERFWTYSVRVALCLLLPAFLFVFQMVKSYQAESYTTTTHWKNPADPSKMNWNDILFLKEKDWELLDAPYYFDLKILENHKHSYPALLHMASFSDTMHFWQEVPANVSRIPFQRTQTFDFPKIQSPLMHQLSKVSIISSIWISVLSLLGALVIGFQSVRFLITGQDLLHPGTAFWALFSWAFYLMMVVNFPRLAEPYQWGYWLPRYVFPSLVSFILFGMVLLDRFAVRVRRPHVFGGIVLAVSIAYSVLYMVIL